MRWMTVAGCLVMLVLGVCAQDSRPASTQKIVLDDGTEVAGVISAKDSTTLAVGDQLVPKWRARDIQGGPERLQGEILLQRYLDETDSGKALRLESRILGLRTLDFAALAELMRTTGIRPPVTPGRSERKFRVRETGETFPVVVYVPEQYTPAQAWPLWITIHGKGGEAADVVDEFKSLADQHGFIVAGLSEIPPRQGKGWGSTKAERVAHRELVWSMIDAFHIDTNRIYVNGWSRGGHGSWDIAMRFPDIFAGAGPVIGSVLSQDRHLLSNLLGMRVDSINGGKDQPGLVDGVREAASLLKGLGVDYRCYIDPTRGHEFFEERLGGMVDFLLAKVRDPDRPRLAFSTYDPEAMRSFWVRVERVSSNAYQRGRQIPVLGVANMTPEEAHRAMIDSVARHTARVTAMIDGTNQVTVDTHEVTQLTVGLPAKLIDFRQKVTLVVNGEKRFTRALTPSKQVLLKTARANHDRRLGWAEVLEVAVK